MDSTAEKLITGQLRVDEIPELPARTVRVFLNSTAKDSVTERNVVVQRVYPELRDYCRQKHGVEFQIVDLDWGVNPDEFKVDQFLSDFKMREIRRSQILSAGPCFMAFIGQRYGEKTLQSSIPADEYDLLRLSLHNHKSRDTRNAPLLDEWYIKDHNSVPPVYFLRDINERIPELLDKNPDVFQEGLEKWQEIETELMRLLQKAADFCYLQGLIDESIKQKYILSVMDSQMVLGMDGLSSPENRCVVVFRQIVDLKNYIQDPIAKKFADIFYNERTEKIEIDPVSSHLIHEMSERSRKLMRAPNILSHNVLWRYDDVISPIHHKDYLEKLSSGIVHSMKNLIDQEVPKNFHEKNSDIYEESLLHWLRCKHIASDFFGRQSECSRMIDYLQNQTDQIFVLHGISGSGKTSLISKISSQVHDLLPSNTVCVIQYIGYTPKSSDIRQILTTICTQILIGLEIQTQTLPRDFKDLQKLFLNLLQSIPDYKVLVLFLDAVEQIRPDFNAHMLSWIPRTLPHNVKVIVGVQSGNDDNSFLNKLCNEVDQDGKYGIQLGPLSVQEADSFLCYCLGRYGRTLSKEQRNAFVPVFQTCSLPLFVSLCAEKCKHIRSFDKLEASSFAKSLDSAIHQLFADMEVKHGKELFSRSMSYLVASVTGLSDCEMEDLLSLDDHVMNCIYTNFHPPLRRIPHNRWLRIKDEMDRYLIHREVDGITVTRWKDNEFNKIVHERYLSDPTISKEIYSMLADYYLGTWAGKSKPIGNSNSENEALPTDRNVPTQPLTFECDGHVRFNRRKYDQVPRHLYNAERLKELNQLVLFNYEWIYNKIKALSLQQIMEDFALNPSEEASLVEEALRVAEPVIEKDINNMASEISGHLLPYYQTHPNIRALVNQCDTTGLKQCALIPNFPYFQVPGSSLQFTFNSGVPMEYFRFVNQERTILTKERDSSYVHVYDVVAGEKKQNIFASKGALYVTPNGRIFVIIDHITEKAIKVHSAETGDYIGQLIVLNHIELKPKEKYKLGKVCITNNRLCAIVTTDISYLCIANIETCQFLQIIGLDGKCDVCMISSDGNFVICNSNEFLFVYDLYTLQHLSTFSVGYRPTCFAVSRDGSRAYLTNDLETKLMVLHINQGKVDMAYKSVLDRYMSKDTIKDLRISPRDDMVLIRGMNNILVYSRENEKIIAIFHRPENVPKEFKLPKSHYIDLFFTNAEFTHEGKFVVGTLFRNIYLWEVATKKLVTAIQAPVGIIKEMLIAPKRGQLITHIDASNEFQAWNIDEAVKPVNMLDKLSEAITDIQITRDGSVAYVMCNNGDEIGVIEMKTGIMVDLLTHDSPVDNFSITPDGNYALVSLKPKKKDVSVKLWNLQERKVIKEFGNASGFCIPATEKPYIMFVSQQEISFKAPYFITMFQFEDQEYKEYTHPLALRFVLEKPFLTGGDRYLVVLTAHEYVESKAMYETPTICTFSMDEDMKVSYFTPDSFKDSIHIESIVDMKPCMGNPYTIAVMYKSKEVLDINDNSPFGGLGGGSRYGFMVLDICSGSVVTICDPFLAPSFRLKKKLLFDSSYSFCLDDQSNVFDIREGCYVGQLPAQDQPPKMIALNGTVVIYYHKAILSALRLTTGEAIARCDVHSNICRIAICRDDRTLIVGCEDGSVASYVLIDPTVENATDVLEHIGSRQEGESKKSSSRRQSVSWDKVENGECAPQSRPVSAISNGPTDKIILKQVEPAPAIRPSSDTLLYLNAKSKACAIM